MVYAYKVNVMFKPLQDEFNLVRSDNTETDYMLKCHEIHFVRKLKMKNVSSCQLQLPNMYSEQYQVAFRQK